jgi:hypothetical protein
MAGAHRPIMGGEHMIRRTAGRLLVVGLATVVLATPGAASAILSLTGQVAPAAEAGPAATTTCSVTSVGFSSASGTCQNPDPGLVFRVTAWCDEWDTPFIYLAFSSFVSTFDVARAFCFSGDRIFSASTEIKPAPPPPPVIHSLTCQSAGFTALACTVSASGWTQLRWTINGKQVSFWNNKTSIQANCSSGQPTIQIEEKLVPVKVVASNSSGSTQRQTSVSCIVIG